MGIPALANKTSFYHSLSTFKDFSTVLHDSHYSDVPEDWFILLTDIKGSTKAIEQGRYKQVNMIGAGSITCVLNCLGDFEIPFVFGGDGATLLIPPEALKAVSEQLKGLQALAKSAFKIDLRVGFVPLQLLLAQKYSLKVAKYELSPGNCLAQFRGGALSKAEELVKGNSEEAIVLNPPLRPTAPNLDGLSCRLNPLPSRKGHILSLVCKPRTNESVEIIFQDILDRLKSVLEDDYNSASPVNIDNVGWNYISPTLNEEIHLTKKQNKIWTTAIKVLIKTLIANFSLKMNFRLGAFLPKKYKTELVINSDFKKFDEVLRMVIDCSDEQSEVIESLLRSKFELQKIFYGVHKSKSALMTCMVFSASQNQHVHFIDGSNGGYAFAAANMKKQIATAKTYYLL